MRPQVNDVSEAPLGGQGGLVSLRVESPRRGRVTGSVLRYPQRLQDGISIIDSTSAASLSRPRHFARALPGAECGSTVAGELKNLRKVQERWERRRVAELFGGEFFHDVGNLAAFAKGRSRPPTPLMATPAAPAGPAAAPPPAQTAPAQDHPSTPPSPIAAAVSRRLTYQFGEGGQVGFDPLRLGFQRGTGLEERVIGDGHLER